MTVMAEIALRSRRLWTNANVRRFGPAAFPSLKVRDLHNLLTGEKSDGIYISSFGKIRQH